MSQGLILSIITVFVGTFIVTNSCWIRPIYFSVNGTLVLTDMKLLETNRHYKNGSLLVSRKLKLISFFLVMMLIISNFSMASDHVDGPMTIDHPMADISDLFVFPSPNNPENLVLILNVYPFVPWNGHFADRVTYSLIAKNAKIAHRGQNTAFKLLGEEKRIDCTFVTPHRKTNWASCVFPHGESIRFEVDKEGVKGNGFQVFAGRRGDPFLFNSSWFKELVKEGKIPKANTSNDMKYLNVLSLIFEINIAQVFGTGETDLWAIAGETTTRDSVNSPVRRIDRVGRPELSNARLAAFNKQTDLRDLYNAQDTFAIDPDSYTKFRTRMLDNINYYDNLDKTVDWLPAWRDALAGILLNDFLVVDMSKPMTVQSYFDIERSAFRNQPHTRAGGRVPGDNIINALFTTMINGGHGREVSNGISTYGKPAIDHFPYLRKPSRNPIAFIKSYLARSAATKLSME